MQTHIVLQAGRSSVAELDKPVASQVAYQPTSAVEVPKIVPMSVPTVLLSQTPHIFMMMNLPIHLV